jgi:hypothetical protein
MLCLSDVRPIDCLEGDVFVHVVFSTLFDYSAIFIRASIPAVVV